MGAAQEWRRGWTWPDWTFGGRPSTRREKLGATLGPAPFLLFLIEPVTDTFSSSGPFGIKLLILLLALAYAAVYLVVCGIGQGLGHWQRVVLIGSGAIFPILFAILLGPDSLVLSTYVISSALMLWPRNAGALLGLGFTAALLIGTKIADGAPNWADTWVLAVLTVAMFTFGALISTIKQLRAAQSKMAKLAVAEERSRLARDLHDVLGHSLTTITVKAGLARRVLESSSDRERAIAEVRDVEELAREAMAEVRATVSGYRTPSLAAELVGARAALQAAGIAAQLPQAVDDVPAGLREVFAYVVREGVTNVIRHSGATRCEVRLGQNWLEVRDNGTACGEAVTRSRETGGGHGLSGLAERVASVEGTLDAGPLPEGGFLLKVTAKTPVKQRESAEQPAVGLTSAAQPWAGLA
ncbi:MAG TPA: sensor histidine kinase [Pseudonocardiaceae bacterium]|nr:sensor histidine kinase [Pseudonocardiaceae bacterium]